MNRFQRWLLKRFLMNRLKAFFGSMRDLKASEFYAGWASIVMKAVCLVNGAACTMLDTAAGWIGFGSGKALLATLFTYTALRMTSKAAKAGGGKKAAEAPSQ